MWIINQTEKIEGTFHNLYVNLAQLAIASVAALLVYHSFIVIFQCSALARKWDQRKKKQSRLRRQMTPIGKFALLSQTDRNPSIISFFLALSNKKGGEGIGIDEFEQLWRTRVMSKHERFRCRVSEPEGGFFEEIENKSFDEYAEELPHPNNREEFKSRVSTFLTSHIDVTEQLWEANISTGPIGASGAIVKNKSKLSQDLDSETVALFRTHHVLCDGVSLSAVIADASDEADRLNSMIVEAIEKHKRQTARAGMLEKAIRLVIGIIAYYILGSIKALTIQMWNMMTSTNPFDRFIKSSRVQAGKRSVSWKLLADIEDTKRVVRIAKHATLNDLFVTILNSALEKQYVELCRQNDDNAKNTVTTRCPSKVNVVVPVHLTGGIIFPGQSIGNKIGAFVTSIPFHPSSRETSKKPNAKSTPSIPRLHRISEILRSTKRTPAPQLSWLITAMISTFLPWVAIAKYAMVRANCHAVAVISNVKGFPFQIHWNGHGVETLCAFLPLPPGIPIGIVVQTYDGMIILSIDADKRVVPDADRFLDYMAEEYEKIKSETVMEH